MCGPSSRLGFGLARGEVVVNSHDLLIRTIGRSSFLRIFYSRICIKLSNKLPHLIFIIPSSLFIRLPYITLILVKVCASNLQIHALEELFSNRIDG